jgi:hypothetical protein
MRLSPSMLWPFKPRMTDEYGTLVKLEAVGESYNFRRNKCLNAVFPPYEQPWDLTRGEKLVTKGVSYVRGFATSFL